MQSLLILFALHINFVLVRKVSEIKSQKLIDSKKMFLKFRMIFAKSLSFVNDKIFHTKLFICCCRCFFLYIRKGSKWKILFPQFFIRCQKGILNFYHLFFTPNSLWFEFSNRVFIVFFLRFCLCLCKTALFHLSFALIYTFAFNFPGFFSSQCHRVCQFSSSFVETQEKKILQVRRFFAQKIL